jgi:hypothetical protein
MRRKEKESGIESVLSKRPNLLPETRTAGVCDVGIVHNDLVQVGILEQNIPRVRSDHRGNMGGGEGSPERPNQRSCQHNVADAVRTDHQYAFMLRHRTTFSKA